MAIYRGSLSQAVLPHVPAAARQAALGTFSAAASAAATWVATPAGDTAYTAPASREALTGAARTAGRRNGRGVGRGSARQSGMSGPTPQNWTQSRMEEPMRCARSLLVCTLALSAACGKNVRLNDTDGATQGPAAGSAATSGSTGAGGSGTAANGGSAAAGGSAAMDADATRDDGNDTARVDAGGRPCLVVEWLEGEDLSRRQRRAR